MTSYQTNIAPLQEVLEQLLNGFFSDETAFAEAVPGEKISPKVEYQSSHEGVGAKIFLTKERALNLSIQPKSLEAAEAQAWFHGFENFSLFLESTDDEELLAYSRKLHHFLSSFDESELKFQSVMTLAEKIAQGKSPRNNEDNLAAFYWLKVLTESKRSLPVIRPNQSENWLCQIEADVFYPWVDIWQKTIDQEVILQQWKSYAQEYSQHQLPLTIYIHIPFCAKRCNFCYCVMQETQSKDEVELYAENLVALMQKFGNEVKNVEVTVVSFGGGTPSMLTSSALSKVLSALKDNFRLSPRCEITFEANPDSMTTEKIDIWQKQGPLYRMLMGLQTLDPKAQQAANRFNRQDKVLELISYAKSKGVSVVEVDLILGLDDQSDQSVEKDLRLLLEQWVNSVRLYIYKPFAKISEVEYRIDEEQKQRRVRQQKLAQKIIEQHEIKKNNLQNRKVMRESNMQTAFTEEGRTAMLGLGVSAVSYIPRRMFYESINEVEAFQKNNGDSGYYFWQLDQLEDLHNFAVKTLHEGIDLNDLMQKYDEQTILTVFQDWQHLQRLGGFFDAPKIRFQADDLLRPMLAKYYLFSEKIKKQLADSFYGEYRAEIDYISILQKIVEE